MEIYTHQQIDRQLCGEPVEMADGYCRVRFLTTESMITDDSGLIHGGFIFGAADYAAMLAVNHPNVVLGAASVKFLKPVKADETIIAEARIHETEGKRRLVAATVWRGEDRVFEGEFTCFVPDRHVLTPS
ncbi:MAG: PaaI family thioesterase [Desulfobacterales bacterium]|nr:PaaI family thioesterase [Desulfobacterales bacterium]